MEPHSTVDTQVGHCKADDTDVYIGRGTDFANIRTTDIGEYGWLGNPFVPQSNIRDGHVTTDHITIVSDREESVTRFRDLFETRLKQDDEFRDAVRDVAQTALGCWCQRLNSDRPACHGEVIAEHADRLAD